MELVQAFQEQVQEKKLSSLVHATDSDPVLSSACHMADASALMPRISSPNYLSSLKEYCLANDIGLIVPTIDTELSLLASVRDEFSDSDIDVIISSPEFISACRDKRLTGKLFSERGLRYPEIYTPATLRFPCFAKPYDGSSSIGARVVSKRAEIDSEVCADPKIMFMELLGESFCEYTVDAYFDRNSRLKCVVPRKRLEVRSGEVSKGITKKNFVFEKFSMAFSFWPGARGCITIQVFVDENVEEIVGLEVNPRFGGGFPLTYAAGANFPGWLIDEYLLDIDVSDYADWEDRLMMLRYDAKLLVSDSDA